VNTHKNARLTAWGRAELIRRLVHDQESVATVAAALHLSRQTVYKWRRRFVAEGWAGLAPRSSRPQRSPRATPARLVRRILRLRLQRQTGPEIAEALGLPPSTVGRILQRLGLGRLKQPAAASGPAYVRATPGDLVHLDIKGLDRFTAVGHRIHGDRRRGGRRQGLGKDFLHVAVDDATRLAYAAVYPTQDAAACTAFLQAARRWYATLGIDVQAVMTDNAKAYLSLPFQQQLAGALIRHLTTRPYRPQTNGKAERFIQTALRRWAFKRPYRTSRHRSAALPTFLDSYNIERPHRALGRIPPLLYFLMRCEQRP
jgi:transposase InsO family protein